MSRFKYGMDHPSWEHPVMYADDPQKVRELMERTYDASLGHYIVGPVEQSIRDATGGESWGDVCKAHPHDSECEWVTEGKRCFCWLSRKDVEAIIRRGEAREDALRARIYAAEKRYLRDGQHADRTAPGTPNAPRNVPTKGDIS